MPKRNAAAVRRAEGLENESPARRTRAKSNTQDFPLPDGTQVEEAAVTTNFPPVESRRSMRRVSFNSTINIRQISPNARKRQAAQASASASEPARDAVPESPPPSARGPLPSPSYGTLQSPAFWSQVSGKISKSKPPSMEPRKSAGLNATTYPDDDMSLMETTVCSTAAASALSICTDEEVELVQDQDSTWDELLRDDYAEVPPAFLLRGGPVPDILSKASIASAGQRDVSHRFTTSLMATAAEDFTAESPLEKCAVLRSVSAAVSRACDSWDSTALAGVESSGAGSLGGNETNVSKHGTSIHREADTGTAEMVLEFPEQPDDSVRDDDVSPDMTLESSLHVTANLSRAFTGRGDKTYDQPPDCDTAESSINDSLEQQGLGLIFNSDFQTGRPCSSDAFLNLSPQVNSLGYVVGTKTTPCPATGATYVSGDGTGDASATCSMDITGSMDITTATETIATNIPIISSMDITTGTGACTMDITAIPELNSTNLSATSAMDITHRTAPIATDIPGTSALTANDISIVPEPFRTASNVRKIPANSTFVMTNHTAPIAADISATSAMNISALTAHNPTNKSATSAMDITTGTTCNATTIFGARTMEITAIPEPNSTNLSATSAMDITHRTAHNTTNRSATSAMDISALTAHNPTNRSATSVMDITHRTAHNSTNLSATSALTANDVSTVPEPFRAASNIRKIPANSTLDTTNLTVTNSLGTSVMGALSHDRTSPAVSIPADGDLPEATRTAIHDGVESFLKVLETDSPMIAKAKRRISLLDERKNAELEEERRGIQSWNALTLVDDYIEKSTGKRPVRSPSENVLPLVATGPTVDDDDGPTVEGNADICGQSVTSALGSSKRSTLQFSNENSGVVSLIQTGNAYFNSHADPEVTDDDSHLGSLCSTGEMLSDDDTPPPVVVPQVPKESEIARRCRIMRAKLAAWKLEDEQPRERPVKPGRLTAGDLLEQMRAGQARIEEERAARAAARANADDDGEAFRAALRRRSEAVLLERVVLGSSWMNCFQRLQTPVQQFVYSDYCEALLATSPSPEVARRCGDPQRMRESAAARVTRLLRRGRLLETAMSLPNISVTAQIVDDELEVTVRAAPLQFHSVSVRLNDQDTVQKLESKPAVIPAPTTSFFPSPGPATSDLFYPTEESWHRLLQAAQGNLEECVLKYPHEGFGAEQFLITYHRECVASRQLLDLWFTDTILPFMAADKSIMLVSTALLPTCFSVELSYESAGSIPNTPHKAKFEQFIFTEYMEFFSESDKLTLKVDMLNHQLQALPQGENYLRSVAIFMVDIASYLCAY